MTETRPPFAPIATPPFSIALSIGGTDENPLWRAVLRGQQGGSKWCCAGHAQPEDAIDHGVNVVRWSLAATLAVLPPDSYGAQVLAGRQSASPAHTEPAD